MAAQSSKPPPRSPEEARRVREKVERDLDAVVSVGSSLLSFGARVAKLGVRAAATPAKELLKKAIKALEEED
jgi:hypothetical protein